MDFETRPSVHQEINISGYFIKNKTEPDAKERCQARFKINNEPDDDFEEAELMEDDRETIQRNSSKNTEEFVVTSGNTKWETILVDGPFFSTSPWWQVEMRVKQRYKDNKTFQYECNLHYTLNDSETFQSLSILLTKCKVEKQLIAAFQDWLTSSGKSSSLKLSSVKSLLEEFALSETEGHRECAHQIKMYIESHDEMKLIEAGSKHPKLMYHLPAIFTKHCYALLTKDDDTLEKLEEILETTPYMFGFKQMMGNRGMKGCEAPIETLQQCYFYKDLSPDIKAALHVYDIMKCACKEGHTYLLKEQLLYNQWAFPYKYTDLIKKIQNARKIYIKRQWDKVQRFFKQNPRILTFKKVNGNLQIHYEYFLLCEERICRQLRHLMDQSDPLILKQDSSKSDINTFNGDQYQVRGAECIRKEPVVILSGAGGCGKTHVLSEVLKEHKATEEACRQEEMCRGRRCGEVDEKTNNIDENLVDDRKMVEDNVNHDHVNGEKQAESGNECTDENEIAKSHVIGTEEMKAEENQEIETTFKKCPFHPIELVEDEILLTAPTGKAATILRTRTSLPSSTLHKIQYSYHRFLQENDEDFKWKFKDVRILVVDESSMVNLAVFSQVLNVLLKGAKLQKVIFLGDIHQLPSIGAGNLFLDLYKACGLNGSQIIPCVKLVNNHRAESQAIVNNAQRIRQQKMPKFDDERFILVTVQRKHDLKDDTKETFEKLLKFSTDPTIKDHQRSQVISFTRDYCTFLNDSCCRYYNKHTVKGTHGDYDFKVDDKICCTKNAELPSLIDLNQSTIGCKAGPRQTNKVEKPKNLINVSNGEVFFIKQDIKECGKTVSRWVLSYGRDKQGKENMLEVDVNSMFKLAKVRHAWAKTIHTFQGSEAETIVYVLGKQSQFVTWQHIYTAVTRGRSRVYIVGTLDALKSAINEKPQRRQTYLCTLLRETSRKTIKNLKGKSEECRLDNGDSPCVPPTSPPSVLTEAAPSNLAFSHSPEAARLAKSFPNSAFAQSMKNQRIKMPTTGLEVENLETKTPTKRPNNKDLDTPNRTPAKKSCTTLDDVEIKRSPRACFRLKY